LASCCEALAKGGGALVLDVDVGVGNLVRLGRQAVVEQDLVVLNHPQPARLRVHARAGRILHALQAPARGAVLTSSSSTAQYRSESETMDVRRPA
jgi:hypothetical protein